MKVTSFWSGEERFVYLYYKASRKGEQEAERSCKIKVAAVPSNLGKGEVCFFVCPISERPCKHLYLSYQTRMFVSWESYPTRIYFRSQLSSKLGKANDRFWSNDAKLKTLDKERHTFKYRGKKTRHALRVERLEEKRRKADRVRWLPRSMPLLLRRTVLKLMFTKRTP